MREFSDETRKTQILYRDAEESINNAKDFLKELEGQNTQHNIHIKVYSSASECFMLLTDDSVLVEQYHYGKIRPPEEDAEKIKSKILGGDVPVIEYKKPKPQILRDHPLRNPYGIFKDHFEYVFTHCAKDV